MHWFHRAGSVSSLGAENKPSPVGNSKTAVGALLPEEIFSTCPYSNVCAARSGLFAIHLALHRGLHTAVLETMLPENFLVFMQIVSEGTALFK